MASPLLPRIARFIERVIDALLAAALVVMVAAMLYQVFGRYVLGHAPSWSEELARYLMVWLTMLGSASVLRAGGHITVTALVDRMPPLGVRIVLALRDLAVVAATGVLAWWGVQFAQLNAVQESAAMEIPMSLPYAALPAGAGLIALLVVIARITGDPFPAATGEQF